MLRIKLIKSPIAQTPKNRATVRGLGLRKMHQEVLQPDNPAIRGMIHHVKHMLTVEVVEGEVAKKKVGKSAKPVAAAPKTPEPKTEVAEVKPKAATKASAEKKTAAKPAAKKAPAKKAKEVNDETA
jgi:large subunit ribosomal protein L30